MDLAHIPRSFWHALSACMLMSTIGLLMIAYRSATVSIEIADAKINLSSAMATAKEIKSELQSENERLQAANEQLQKAVQDQLATLTESQSTSKPAIDFKALSKSLANPALKPAARTELFTRLDQKLLHAEQSLKTQ